MENALLELIEAVKNLAPEVWAILIKQVYINSITMCIWIVVLIVATVVLWKFGKYAQKKDKKSTNYSGGWEMVYILSYVSCPFCGIGSIILISNVVGYLINPEYYVIKLLLSAISGGC